MKNGSKLKNDNISLKTVRGKHSFDTQSRALPVETCPALVDCPQT